MDRDDGRGELRRAHEERVRMRVRLNEEQKAFRRDDRRLEWIERGRENNRLAQLLLVVAHDSANERRFFRCREEHF